ncbi:hypothetical protein L1887_08397 [Cichorium endivia]|nr:hypothetical protein L1887_08397 [Cichorium endivia]
MFRQSPRRNGRNKGLKIKHILQISLLLGVSVWLLYQVHQSDEKKPPIPSNITKKLHNVVNKDMLRLGRKDLQPKVNEPTIQNKKETQEHQTEEAGNNTEPEELVHDHKEHEDKHEEDRENENTNGDEETTETEHEQIKGHENEENGVKNETVKEVVVENKKKEDENKTYTKPIVENWSSEQNKGPINAQNKDSSPGSNLMPFVDLKIKKVVNGNSEDLMNSNGKDEKENGDSDSGVEEKEQESNENENENENSDESEGGVLEEEKEALTDLGTLPESGIGGSRSTENTAAE